jgi:CheY-like chemotaxis protein
LRILVVDDDADTREILVKILETCGAEVMAVGSAPEAIAALEELKPDVLVSDIGLPQQDGYALIRSVRLLETEQGKIPAVALTAYARGEDREAALSAGFQSHLAKPVEPSELVAVVVSVARRNRNS